MIIRNYLSRQVHTYHLYVQSNTYKIINKDICSMTANIDRKSTLSKLLASQSLGQNINFYQMFMLRDGIGT